MSEPLQYGWMHSLGGGVTAVDPDPELLARIEDDMVEHGDAPLPPNAHRLRWSCSHGYGWATFQWLGDLAAILDCEDVRVVSVVDTTKETE